MAAVTSSPAATAAAAGKPALSLDQVVPVVDRDQVPVAARCVHAVDVARAGWPTNHSQACFFAYTFSVA